MPRKRNANGDGDATPVKKKKVEEVSLAFRWEYEGDKRTWTQYSSAIDSSLTDAYNTKKKQVDFELSNGIKMAVNFEKNVQKNKKTGWERPIRIAVKDDSDTLYYVWQWEDEKGNMNPYGVKNTLELETAHKQMKDSITIEACSRSYSVDIQNMEQKNTVTDVTRKVFREESNAIKADPGAPEPVATTSSADTPKKATKGSTGAGKSGGKVKDEPDDEVETKAAKSGGGKSGSKTKSGAKERPAVKSIVLSGKAPVDAECTSLVGKAHVYYEGKDVYDCMLNQTNVSNNNNKYFIIQLLEADDKKMYYTWFRWGRVGYSGSNNLIPCGVSLDAAKKHFFKKFKDKTLNDWANRKHFVKHQGKYDQLEMDYGVKDAVDAPELKKKKSEGKVPDSKLDKRLQSLVDLICDVKSMEEAVMEMQYDAKKAPLGKLTADQIKAGYKALKKIDACIEKKDFGSTLNNACDEFYTRIPHDFGMKPPTKINTKEQVKQKIALLEALVDIEIAIKMLKEGDYSENPVDRHYHSLKCDIEPLDHKSEEFKLVETYLQNTHAKTHNQYKMKLVEVFDVSKHGEKEHFNDVGNRLLLWHGSRLTNWAGILSQGLRIAPPEAPVTGYMFGKGVYFADMSSKSANYCFATRAKNTGLMLLCDVALGNTNDLLAADYKANKLPAGKHSVKGAGKIAPDPSHVTKTPDGAVVPWGKAKDTGVTNPKGYTLNYNEFIVYDTRQIKMKYLLKIDFKF
ncbi:poly [ADP-ribose] polymerase 2-like isoform X2 [Ruditapes philippinarum]|uniref:poly [ADP-ribose] polymerase 2-like isoform X2 n=1 Tax=Ruditapes philippinarum TaxID=129788 RepID=UPI00295B9654|nr:poly [ADP-ribose] polymerase 2-like isoform X2 [Ruditapes philippinarum]